MTARAWILTIFDNEWDHETVWAAADKAKLTLMCGQLETSPTTGREHWQVYCETDSMRSAGVKRLVSLVAHVEPRRGTRAEAIAYVTKEDTAVPGTRFFYPNEQRCKPEAKGQGRRSDLDGVHEALKEGATLEELSDSHFKAFIKYHKGLEKYKSLKMQPRKHKTELLIFYGEPGTGKSRLAAELCEMSGESTFYLRKGNGGALWWDGYDGQANVVVDDFYGWMPWDTLLRIADRYPLRVDTKGSSVEFVAKRIIITSNSAPRDWYNTEHKGIDYRALVRRISECVYYGVDYKVPVIKNGTILVENPPLRKADDKGKGLPWALEALAEVEEEDDAEEVSRFFSSQLSEFM